MWGLSLLLGLVAAAPHKPGRERDLPGTFVRFADLDHCPPLRPRPIPTRVDDVRPDDFSVVMALGDSISAALLARGGWDPQTHTPSSPQEEGQVTFLAPSELQAPNPGVPDIQEWRGLSYAAGGDEGALTIPNLLSHYNPVVGMSYGRHPVLCVGLGEGCHPPSDGLNGAISGSIAASLLGQAKDLVPRYKALNASVRAGWTYVNLAVGANDICAFCLSSNLPLGPGSPEEFAAGVSAAVEVLRQHIPRLIVNIVGLFRVSAVYKLTLDDPYCQGPYHPPVPHLPLECSCATLPGPVGDYTRRRMDELGQAYDEAVRHRVRQWDAERNSTFAAIWQPGTALDLEHYPIEAVSPIDCFHPSEEAHKRLAAGVWNRLVLPQAYKTFPFAWEGDVWVRCLEADDRVQVRQVL
ncbi:hypothetical protein CcaverHIS002_0310190 [Cutaneotrichosporon cavernicola]|uniref:SGNH hydrolase n=1 Tax=Cutaneotrichosporon cavernicola TaxID=279322 RepID=A0AA48KZU8_9TREE|nr:uncharacterized protein CcaverHIS019_0310040 [Cutaneotrichosporon cavernicola]BEI83151.1 hypothetical protein CcaverHIS002_0310190 [Cutaneotrichosporon cavernicola]BEI90934.1 hypothetical protein CcaverHIS019_0310040 [Cutaneotrichosporon cavernicola]BEI98713.1 hypothetical protein CcaverHIS631_0310120 [Cutaneotrichosporon cavernicola]BEJ06484.1 hypothetical protein CcaverHIS641_0310060 [Cutaneotrichosporon cavernicola]